ncbi:MAG: hypothetical protein CUN56_04035 [Phototrophicales bacterium]|nr:MAG: hypothetical protein CUN56_04035 [Phototrophicales bacterium]
MSIIMNSKVRLMILTLFVVFIIVVGLLLITRQNHDPFHADAIIDPPFTSLTYGVQIFGWWDVDGTTLGHHLEWVRLLAFTHAKQIFAWQDIEPNPDEWHFDVADRIVSEAENKGVYLVVRLSDAPDWAHPSLPPQSEGSYVDAPADNPDDWAEFCGMVAARYAGRIRAYQIWNEPNLSREWGNRPPNAADYVVHLRACSEAIRAADPNAIIISAGLSPTGNMDDTAHRDDLYLQAMYDANFQQYVDVVGVHAPGWGVPPEYGPDDAERDGRGRWATFRRVEDLRKIMIANEDAARQIAILEMGYTIDQTNPDYAWHAVNEAQQRDYLVAAFRYAAEHWRPWVGLMSVIYFAKPGWTQADEQFWWALNDAETGAIRPAFAGLAQMEKYCGDVIFPARDEYESAYAPEYNPCH